MSEALFGEEKITLTRGQKRLREEIASKYINPALRRWSQDHDIQGREDTDWHDAEIRWKQGEMRGADVVKISTVLTSLVGTLSIDEWPKDGVVRTGTYIYFPRTEEMESAFIPTPASPKEFLTLLKRYETEGKIPTDAIPPPDTEVLMMETPPDPEDHSETSESLLASLSTVDTLEEYSHWLAENKRHFQAAILSQTFTADGRQTNIRAEINRRALDIIQDLSAGISTLEDLERLRAEVNACRFFPSPHVPVRRDMSERNVGELVERHIDPSRKAANKILRTVYWKLETEKIQAIQTMREWEEEFRNAKQFQDNEARLPNNRRILTMSAKGLINAAFTKKAKVLMRGK